MSRNPAALLPVFKPEWAFDTPDGYRDEVFLVSFTFIIGGSGALVSKLPWSFDDDVPFILRGIVFPEVGTHEPNGLSQVPGLVRIWDSHGNPLSDDLVLALGVWSQSGFGLGNAFGFPIEPQIEFAPGGVAQFDFQLTSNANPANVEIAGGTDTIRFVAGVLSAAGNAFTIQLINPGAPNVPISVALVGGIHVQVTLATDGGGAITSTFQNVADAVNAAAAAGSLPLPAPLAAFPLAMAVVIIGDGTEVITAVGPLTFGGPDGADFVASVDQYVAGTFLGVKRFKDC